MIAVIRKHFVVVPNVADDHSGQAEAGLDPNPTNPTLPGHSQGHVTDCGRQDHSNDPTQDNPTGIHGFGLCRCNVLANFWAITTRETPADRAESIVAALGAPLDFGPDFFPGLGAVDEVLEKRRQGRRLYGCWDTLFRLIFLEHRGKSGRRSGGFYRTQAEFG